MAMHNPPHPGEFISAVYLEPNGLSGRELAGDAHTVADGDAGGIGAGNGPGCIGPFAFFGGEPDFARLRGLGRCLISRAAERCLDR